MKKRLSTPRAATVIVLAAVVALSVTVAPSIAASFLTPQAASKKFVTNQKAAKTYLTKAQANCESGAQLPDQEGRGQHLPAEKRLAAAAGRRRSPRATRCTRSTSRRSGYIPTAFVSFATKANVSDAVITFSGNASCTSRGKRRPWPVLPDHDPRRRPARGEQSQLRAGDRRRHDQKPAAALVHTVMQTTVLGKGGHTIAIQYAGAAS